MNIEEKVAQNGFRLTAPRKKILSIFAQQSHPISFENYTLLDPSLDKSTFYRTMQTFENAHIIHGIESDEGKRYFELIDELHPHFVCQNCHSIICLDPIASPQLDGYSVHSIIYKGICPQCYV